MKNIKLYNVIFPVWLLYFFPLTWFFVIPANFVIDSLVLLAGMYLLNIENKKEFYKKNIIWVFIFGFAADFVGAGVLFLSQVFGEIEWVYEYLTAPLAMNPYDNIYSLLYTIAAVIISGVFIYIFNRFISFRKSSDIKNKRILSLILAVVTAPYLFLVPTATLNGYASDNFTNHFVYDSYIQAELYLADDLQTDVLSVKEGEHFKYDVVSVFRDAINLADKSKKSELGDIKYKIVFYKTGENANKLDEIIIYQNNSKMYFEWDESTFQIKDKNVQLIFDAVDSIKNPEK